MAATRSRFLSSSTNSSSSHQTGDDDPSPSIRTLDSDFVVILAALLCALICVLGLVAVARCSWFRRIWYGRSSEQPPPAPNKGVKKKVLKSLPKTTYGGEREENGDNCKISMECPICLSEFEIGEELRVLPQCGHRFHVECVDRWLRSHSSCPSCRQLLIASASRCHNCGGGLPEDGGGGGGRRCGDRRSHEVRESSSHAPNVFLP